jgi:hypothetical protein
MTSANRRNSLPVISPITVGTAHPPVAHQAVELGSPITTLPTRDFVSAIFSKVVTAVRGIFSWADAHEQGSVKGEDEDASRAAKKRCDENQFGATAFCNYYKIHSSST